MTRSTVILAHDPGSRNYGYSVVKGSLSARQLRFQIVQYGLIQTTIDDLKGGALQTKGMLYLASMQQLEQQFSPKAVIAERYQPRGVSGQTTIECVNIMLGSLFTLFSHLPFKVMPASEWKNALRRVGVDLDAIYEDQKQDIKAHRLTNHEIDACFIGVFGLNRMASFKGFSGTPNVAVDVIDQMRRAHRINLTRSEDE